MMTVYSVAWGSSTYGSSLSGSLLGQQWQAMSSTGQAVRAQNMRGRLHLYYFGFTQCPDICPSSLANLMQLHDELTPAEQAQLQMVFVSVDPERDTPEVLHAYLDNFGDYFIGITGSPEQIAQMAQQFRVKYRKIPGAQGDNLNYSMEHTSQLYLLDKKGQARLFYYSDADPIKIAQDIRVILSESEE